MGSTCSLFCCPHGGMRTRAPLQDPSPSPLLYRGPAGDAAPVRRTRRPGGTIYSSWFLRAHVCVESLWQNRTEPSGAARHATECPTRIGTRNQSPSNQRAAPPMRII
ncbi:hypothetical protein DPEC_G00345140 [Dallia pectoralis]|uniref:Uncharacterized protein n=1 Tax=Dallia pectoralis TaxID=75939 RepID=A0ACC2F3E8_DALPE|nr:hypothetical protein DPEC_G00345140 [Dallia pectoralis]